jgi:hypothetical protein
MSYGEYVSFNTLVGKTIKSIVGGVGDDLITFLTEEGDHFQMYHSQDCCEAVNVEDIDGDFSDLIGTPVIVADESSNSNGDPLPPGCPDGSDESWTWTFYRIATIKGWVVIRWYGSSNGYYSESVQFKEVRE